MKTCRRPGESVAKGHRLQASGIGSREKGFRGSRVQGVQGKRQCKKCLSVRVKKEGTREGTAFLQQFRGEIGGKAVWGTLIFAMQ